MREQEMQSMNLVVVGHVDHGKSTIVGRMLADTGSLPLGKLEQVRENCRRNSKPFEYAFLLDALKDEQSQGITIDAARCFFKTKKREYIIIDAPGHIEFLKNMVTGASRAEAALLVIDAKEGVQENSKRHGYLLSMLGIRQVAVIVNKMDLVDYRQEDFLDIVDEYSQFLEQLGVKPEVFIPASGFNGDNIVSMSGEMPWYHGKTVLQQLDEFKAVETDLRQPFRMPVQDVYKFTSDGDDRRMIAGTIETGTLYAGDDIVFFPSGKRTKVKTIELFNRENVSSLPAGYACSFTMTDQIYVRRGEMAVKADESRPQTARAIRANLFWLGKEPFQKNKKYFLKLGCTKIGVQIEAVLRVINAATLDNARKDLIEANEVSECILKLDKTLAFDLAADIEATSRFVIVDNYEIAGGGIITEALADDTSWIRDKVIKRNSKWENSNILNDVRALRYGQKPTLVLITGGEETGKKRVAKELEQRLFNEGRFVYYIGMSNILYGIDADIKIENSQENKAEQLRRVAEALHLMLDAGLVVIATIRDLSASDMNIIEEIINREDILLVQTAYLGLDTDKLKHQLDVDIVVNTDNFDSVTGIRRELIIRKVIFSI